jgi:acetoin utilization deacetylase AcuC-like enzyme
MKVVYSKAFEKNYDTNPVECPDRVALAVTALKDYEFVEPCQAGLADISRIHGREHIERVMRRGLFEPARMAAGGAIAAAELAAEGEPAFALIRPPGHHASANRAWGMCFFNNMAIAVERIRRRAGRVLILDIDLHYGDGTVSIFRGTKDVIVVNIGAIDIGFEYIGQNGDRFVDDVTRSLEVYDYDIVCVSAGFDTYIEDWGGLLSNDDFYRIGRTIKEAAIRQCSGKRFAILEGGYHSDLKNNIKMFMEGLA